MYRQRGYGGFRFFPRTISFLLLSFSSLNFSSWWDSGYWKSAVNFKQNMHMNNVAAVQLRASWPCLWFLITNGDRAKFFKYLKVVHYQVQNMVAHNCHSKTKNLTAKTKTSRQKQKHHSKTKNLTAKTKTSRQKQKHHGKNKNIMAKTKHRKK